MRYVLKFFWFVAMLAAGIVLDMVTTSTFGKVGGGAAIGVFFGLMAS